MCCIGMAAIRQVQNDAFLNLQHVQSKESQMNMLIYHTHTAQHQLLQQLICHLYSPRQTIVGYFSHSSFALFQKNDNARDHGCLSPDWTVTYAFCLQGDNGGMTTMSNMTYRVSREEDGLELTCEAFNKGTHFSKTKRAKLSVYCEST